MAAIEESTPTLLVDWCSNGGATWLWGADARKSAPMNPQVLTAPGKPALYPATRSGTRGFSFAGLPKDVMLTVIDVDPWTDAFDAACYVATDLIIVVGGNTHHEQQPIALARLDEVRRPNMLGVLPNALHPDDVEARQNATHLADSLGTECLDVVPYDEDWRLLSLPPAAQSGVIWARSKELLERMRL